MLVAEGGTLSHLKVKVASAPTSGKSLAFTVMKNAVATTLTCTIADTNTTAEDITHSVTVAAGDRLALRCVPSGTPTVSATTFAMQYETTTAKHAITNNTMRDVALTTNATRYEYLGAIRGNGWDATETNRNCLWNINATIKKVYVWLNAAPNGAGKSYTFTIMKNGSAEATSAVAITNAETTGNVTGLSIDVAPGDLLSMRCVPANNPDGVACLFSMAYEADTDGQWNIVGMDSFDTGVTDGQYLALNSVENQQSSATEADKQQMVGAATGSQAHRFTSLRTNVNVAPGATKSRTWTLRKNASTTALASTISGTDTSNTDTESIAIASGDLFAFLYNEANAPTDGVQHRWALLVEEAAAGGLPGNSGNAPGRGRGNPNPGGGGGQGGGGAGGGGTGGGTGNPLNKGFLGTRRRIR